VPGTDRRARGAIEPWTVVAEAAICLGFAAFVVARAIRVSLTYDEAAAYIRYIAPNVLPEFDAGPLAIFNFEVATNHFLSTALTKLAVLVAGSSELALRLPALAGYAMHLWFSTRLLRRLTSPAIAVAGLLLLNLNPYLLDFFALSRGYGLSIGLMMGALYYFFSGRLTRTLFFASAAVLANFSMLNVYVAIILVVTFLKAGLPSTALRPGKAGTTEVSTRAPRRGAFIVLAVVAAIFASLVFSQDPGLSLSLYHPVKVTLEGPTADEQRSVRVWRVDLRGRSTRVTDPGPFRAVRIQMPAATADKVRSIDVVVGNRALSTRPNDTRAWITREIDGIRELESGPLISARRSRFRAFTPVMNWTGDARYAAGVANATTIALVALALFGIVVNLIGRLLARAGLGTSGQWSTISSSVLWVAALAGPPLYLLRRDAQLYFGGTRGLVPDTFYSLIENSFYGRVYSASQTHIAFAVIVASVAAFALFALITYRRMPARARPAMHMLALIAIVSASVVTQRWLFGTVYLVGRTALFYVPLYLLFVVFFCQSLSESGRIGRLLGGALLIAAVSLSAYHCARTFNLQYTLDWRDDAGTKPMMADLKHVVADERPSGARVVLGVEWMYAPAAVYYSHRQVPVDIDVAVAPYSRRVDFLYVAKRHAGAAMSIIQTYPIPNAVLARPK